MMSMDLEITIFMFKNDIINENNDIINGVLNQIINIIYYLLLYV